MGVFSPGCWESYPNRRLFFANRSSGIHAVFTSGWESPRGRRGGMRSIRICGVLCLAGCAASGGSAPDPWFIRAWADDVPNRAVQSREDYFTWVAGFYDGTPFVQGWTMRQAELCASLDSGEARM